MASQSPTGKLRDHGLARTSTRDPLINDYSSERHLESLATIRLDVKPRDMSWKKRQADHSAEDLTSRKKQRAATASERAKTEKPKAAPQHDCNAFFRAYTQGREHDLWTMDKESRNSYTDRINHTTSPPSRITPNNILPLLSLRYAAYHHSSNFKDPDSFIPERWLPGSGYDGDRKNACNPFSVGPRNCIGQK
ncbi:hypothetical protein BM1_08638 [Bipolaris maydis]|nr:hypothetical protein BM1_08638 [Bipolaris maydis]